MKNIQIATFLLLVLSVALHTPISHAQEGQTVVANGISIRLPAGWVADTSDAPFLIMAASDAPSLESARPAAGQQLLVLTVSPANLDETTDRVVASAITEYDPAFDIAQGDIATETYTQFGLSGARTGLVQASIDNQDIFIRAVVFRVALYDIEMMLISNGTLTADAADEVLNGVIINSQILLAALNTNNVIARLDEGPRNVIRTEQLANALPVPLRLEFPLGWDGIAEPNRIALASNQVVLDFLLAADLSRSLGTPGVGIAIYPVAQELLTPDVTLENLVELFARQVSNADYTFSDQTSSTILGFEAVSVNFDGPAGQGTYSVFLAGDVFLQYWTLNNAADQTLTVFEDLLGAMTIESSVIVSLPVLHTPEPVLGFEDLAFRTPRDWNHQIAAGTLYIYDSQAAYDNFATVNVNDPASYVGSMISITEQPRFAFGEGVTTPRQVIEAFGWQETGWVFVTLEMRTLTIDEKPTFLVKFDTPLADTYFIVIDGGTNWLLVNALSTDPDVSGPVLEGILNSMQLR